MRDNSGIGDDTDWSGFFFQIYQSFLLFNVSYSVIFLTLIQFLSFFKFLLLEYYYLFF